MLLAIARSICCCGCCSRNGFTNLVGEHSERGEFSADDSVELEIPTETHSPCRADWVDVKLEDAQPWSKYFVMLFRGQMHIYTDAVEKLDVANKGENAATGRNCLNIYAFHVASISMIFLYGIADFLADIELAGATVLPSTSGKHIEIRNNHGSYFFKFMTTNTFDIW